MSASATRPRPVVPVRTIVVTIALVLLTALALLLVYELRQVLVYELRQVLVYELRQVLVYELRQVLVWIIVAAFFTVALYPVVNWLERYVGGHRALATLMVFFLVLVILAGLLTLFIVPLAKEGASFGQQIPQLLARTNALSWIQSHSDRIGEFAAR
jgi:hypothetical protein